MKYSITFTEKGLPSNTEWYVNLSNGMKSGAITGSSYTFHLTNGSYTYTIATSNKIYEPSPSYGSFTVKGASLSEPVISFSSVKHSVTFTETGLPSNAEWYVNVSGHMYSSNASALTINMNNNTYHYTVSTVNGYTISNNANGNITVDGNNVSISVTFTKNANYTDYYVIISIIAVVAALLAILFVTRHKRENDQNASQQPKETS